MITRRIFSSTLVLIVSLLSHTVSAQTDSVFDPGPPGPNPWDEISNWLFAGIPSFELEQGGFINYGRHAVVDTSLANTLIDNRSANPGFIYVGKEPSDQGSFLELAPDGNVRVTPGLLTDGSLRIGSPEAGGSVLVHSGARLEVDRTTIISNTNEPNASSSLTLGSNDPNAAGVADFVTGTLVNNGKLDVLSNGKITVAGDAYFLPNSSTTVTLGVGMDPPMYIDGTVSLEGDLNIRIPDSPQVGQKYSLMNANQFSFNQFPSGPGTPSPSLSILPFTGFEKNQAAVPSIIQNGDRQELQVEVVPTLNLLANRETGDLFIANPHSEPIEIDGYTVEMSNGKINPETSAQFFLGDSNNGFLNQDAIGELFPHETFVLPPGLFRIARTSLFDVFQFGDPTRFLEYTFTFTTQEGDIVEGNVESFGEPTNNLVLQIDPETGNVTLKNPTNEQVELDFYRVSSSDGILTPDGFLPIDDTWQSLPSNNEFSEVDPKNWTA